MSKDTSKDLTQAEINQLNVLLEQFRAHRADVIKKRDQLEGTLKDVQAAIHGLTKVIIG